MRLALTISLLAFAACAAPKADMTSSSFASRMQGAWLRPGDASCAAGALVARDGERLTITTSQSRQNHRISADAALETATVLIEPGVTTGVSYKFTPEFNATSDARSFNLVVTETNTGKRETWSPCER